jgi:hypothetical protein
VKALAFFVFLFIIAGGGLLIAAAARRMLNPAPSSEWEIVERTEGKDVVVYCLNKLDRQRLRVGAVEFGHPEWDSEIALLRSEAEYRLSVLNEPQKRKALKR